MKKLLFLFAFVLVVFSTQAQTTWYKATTFSVRALPSGIWSPETPTDIPMSVNSQVKRIEIFTESKQIFDYIGFSTEEFINGVLHGSYATDVNYGAVYIEFFIYTGGDVYIQISYSDFQYRYKLAAYEQR